MNVQQARCLAREWVETNVGQWPGLRAAHLVGGITTMAEDAPFPAYKDVDMHLIFDEGSAMLQSGGPFPNILEVEYRGILIEAGLKSVNEYRSPEAVLGNPEIAHHLTCDSVLYDPHRLLRDLQEPVRRGFARRRWVCARAAHERAGLEGALALVPMARAMFGVSGELNLLGYSFTFSGALLSVVALKPPRVGSRLFLHMRERLAEYGRLDLYEEILAVLGLADAEPPTVERLLTEATEAFDLAVQVRRTPHNFQHKLHAHLRPYFVDACRSMLAEGHHREALGWTMPYYVSTIDVILADGPDEVKPKYAGRLAGFLTDLGMAGVETLDARFARARQLHDECFALADEIIASHPAIAA